MQIVFNKPNDVPVPGFNPNEQQQQPQNWNTDEVDKSAHSLPPLMSVKIDKPDEVKSNSSSNKPISGELILPKALEDVLAFKDQLADELGRADGEIPYEPIDKNTQKSTGVISTDYADADAESDEDDDQLLSNVESLSLSATKAQNRLDKNKKKKQRKKQNKKNRQQRMQQTDEKQLNGIGDDKTVTNNNEKQTNGNEKDIDDDVTIEYVADKITVADLGPMYRQFYRVFELFKLEEKSTLKDESSAEDKDDALKKDKENLIDDEDEDMDDDKKDDKEKLSKRKMKKLTRLSVAELKQLVGRPDVVEMHDITARDPKLLVQLKAHRNTVQVPRHWCFKRKYLQGKRGIEKPPFDLPAFIKKTGIMEMRASLQEKDEAKTLKAKMRERARPKMGKIDIDYQKLHDAFFK